MRLFICVLSILGIAEFVVGKNEERNSRRAAISEDTTEVEIWGCHGLLFSGMCRPCSSVDRYQRCEAHFCFHIHFSGVKTDAAQCELVHFCTKWRYVLVTQCVRRSWLYFFIVIEWNKEKAHCTLSSGLTSDLSYWNLYYLNCFISYLVVDTYKVQDTSVRIQTNVSTLRHRAWENQTRITSCRWCELLMACVCWRRIDGKDTHLYAVNFFIKVRIMASAHTLYFECRVIGTKLITKDWN